MSRPNEAVLEPGTKGRWYARVLGGCTQRAVKVVTIRKIKKRKDLRLVGGSQVYKMDGW